MRVRGPLLRGLPGVLLLTTLLALPALPRAVAEDVSIRLSDACPPGFELRDGSRCLLRNLYEFYDSLQGAGLGGTRTHLPPHRDGFSPQQIDLGRYLFFDPLLSADRSLSCASCHDPALGFSDARQRSRGIGAAETARAA
ncbi:MAG: cytochrome c peroxidase, partial [Gammaproteobacteria bacterium]